VLALQDPGHAYLLKVWRSRLKSNVWERFEATLKRYASKEYAALRPPATEEQIVAAEKATKVRFPKEIREAYLRHDGADFAVGSVLFPRLGSWCTLDELTDNWKMKCEVADGLEMDDHDFGSFPVRAPWWDDLPIRPQWYHKKWIPIGLSKTPSSYYFDMAPGPKGKRGQIICDGGMIDAVLIAPSLNEWIEFLIQSFESGRFVVDPDVGWRDTKWGERTTKSFSFYG
jgi:cell wall assembly regulator SMI1